MILDGLSCRISDKSFTNFTEVLRNTEAKILNTPNKVFITFFVCFYADWNANDVSIVTLLSTSAIKDEMLWTPLREPTEEVIRPKHSSFL